MISNLIKIYQIGLIYLIIYKLFKFNIEKKSYRYLMPLFEIDRVITLKKI